MTHPTKAVYSMLLTDAARVGGSEHSLYSAKDVEHSLAKVEVLDFHQTITVDGVQVSSHTAPLGPEEQSTSTLCWSCATAGMLLHR